MFRAKRSTVRPDMGWTGWPSEIRLRHRENIFRHGVGGLQGIALQSDRGESTLELMHAARADRFGTINHGAKRREIVLRPPSLLGAAGNELEGEVWQPGQSALVLADNLKHCFRVHHPVQRRLHYDRQVTNHGQHEARDQAHVVIKRQPTDGETASVSIDLQRLRARARVAAARRHESAPRPFAARSSRRVLNECQRLRSTLEAQDEPIFVGCDARQSWHEAAWFRRRATHGRASRREIRSSITTTLALRFAVTPANPERYLDGSTLKLG